MGTTLFNGMSTGVAVFYFSLPAVKLAGVSYEKTNFIYILRSIHRIMTSLVIFLTHITTVTLVSIIIAVIVIIIAVIVIIIVI
jgi:hypothetical protein